MQKAVKKAGNNEIVQQEKKLLGNSVGQFIVKDWRERAGKLKFLFKILLAKQVEQA